MRFTENQTPTTASGAFNDDPLLDTPVAAAYLGSSVPTLERHRRFGTGPDWVKMGGLVRYRKSALDSYIEECTRRPHRQHLRAKNATEAA
jgi:predicted DNA-binding transcriptional regulator AlpA